MFIVQKENKIILADTDYQRLYNTLAFMPELENAEIKEVADSEIEQGYDGGWYFKWEAPQKPAELIQQDFTNAIQSYLDTKAQELNYDSCLSVCSYVDTGVARFDCEGAAFRHWRSAVWAKGYEILAQVQSGERGIPTTEELFAELPELVIEYTE